MDDREAKWSYGRMRSTVPKSTLKSTLGGGGRTRVSVMGERQKYRKAKASIVTAVRLDLDTDGFTYRKWGAEQRAKRGDWLVDNDGDVHTVDGEVFARTYRELSPGIYVKATLVWAEVAKSSGAIETKEGQSKYSAGDYLVFNEEDGGDGYCMSREKFEAKYEPIV